MMGFQSIVMGQRNPNHQLIDGKHPVIILIIIIIIIYRVSTSKLVQDFATTHSMSLIIDRFKSLSKFHIEKD